MMAKQKIRIRLKGYDHRLVDQSAEKIVETAVFDFLYPDNYGVCHRGLYGWSRL